MSPPGQLGLQNVALAQIYMNLEISTAGRRQPGRRDVSVMYALWDGTVNDGACWTFGFSVSNAILFAVYWRTPGHGICGALIGRSMGAAPQTGRLIAAVLHLCPEFSSGLMLNG